ncbi:MAG: tail length tape measure protein [Spirochaetes bacterium RBG_13_68_11]|nr:MAG: tail length tape measure protein [Spirochaetes bacterium RBG_13_68_11]
MYIATVPNRNSPPAILLRESYRENGKVKSNTIANLSSLPAEKIEGFRRVLRGDVLLSPEEEFENTRSLPHGHVAAVLGTLKSIGLDTLIATKQSRQRDLATAMIVWRVIDPVSKLSTAQGLRGETARSSLGGVLGIEDVEDDELYATMDWLFTRQGWMEKQLAKRHLADGSLVLYDVTSTYFEGRCCPLARLGHGRDGKKGKLQIVIGLVCNQQGCPVSVEVFEGNTGDPKTVRGQIQKVREKFGIRRIVLVGDRGMITEARIREDLKTDKDLDWVTALRAPAIKELAENKRITPELYDDWGLAEVNCEEYPGERLIVCKNPLLAVERARKRKDLLGATEKNLEEIKQATQREKQPLTGAANIGVRVGKVINHYKMAKHFVTEIGETGFSYRRKEESIAEEGALDGIYVIRTSVSKEQMSAEDAVSSYKRLSVVERAFRCIKTVDLKIRPINHRLAERVRSHVFICMLAYYVEWHMRGKLKTVLFDDTDVQRMEKERISAVAPRERSPKAKRKANSKSMEQGLPAQSFRTLLKDLGTLTKNWMATKSDARIGFVLYTNPTPLQAKVFELLGVSVRM